MTQQKNSPAVGSDRAIKRDGKMSDKNNITHIPQSVYKKFENEIQNISFGGVSLIVSVRDGHPSFRIEKTISLKDRDLHEMANSIMNNLGGV